MTPPFLVAALVLCAAGTAKLRAPATAGTALRMLGLPGDAALVRLLALGEVALATWALAAPSRAVAAAVACLFVCFAAVALLLVRRHASCGCFGADHTPASPVQAVVSAVIAALCAGVAAAGPHGLGWVLDRPAGQAGVVTVAVLAASCAAVLAYTALPAAWEAWDER
jgi:hypothetical protein